MRGVIIMGLGLALLGCPSGGDEKKGDDAKSADSGERDGKKKKGKKKKKGAKADNDKDAPAKDKDAPKASEGGAETPEKAFDKMKKATDEDDWKTFFSMLTQEPQDKMLTGMLIGAAITLAPMGTKPNPDKKKELDAILKKHGLEDTQMDGKGAGPDEIMKEMAKGLAKVKDRPQLFADLMKFLEKNSLQQKRFVLEKMEDLKVDGDKATAKIHMKDGKGGAKTDQVELRKIDGRWYFHVLDWK